MVLSFTMTAQKTAIDLNLLQQSTSSKQLVIPTTQNVYSASRNGGAQLIYDYSDYLNSGDIIHITHDKDNIGKYKYRVELTSFSGDADLILAGNNPYEYDWRQIAESNNGPSSKDVLEYLAWDLTHEETALEIVIFGYSDASFQLKIYKIEEDLEACNHHSTIEEIKDWMCDLYFCDAELFHAEYFGRPVLYYKPICEDALDVGDAIYDCTGEIVANNSYGSTHLIENRFLQIKRSIYKCQTTPQICDQQRVINDIKANMCTDCEEGSLYHAVYDGRPVLYLSRICVILPDLSNRTIIDCQGETIATSGFWSGNINDNLLEINDLIYSCEPTPSTDKNCVNFETYIDNQGIAAQSPDWIKWDENASDATVIEQIYSEFIDGIHYTKITKFLSIVDDGKYNKEDVVYLTGNHRTGKKVIKWDMVIHPYQTGYFNLQMDGQQFGSSLFHIYYENGVATIYNPNRSQILGTFNYPSGAFFEVKIGIDLDHDRVILYTAQENFILNYSGHIQLGGINFYAVDNAGFAIDNLCIQEVNQIPFTNEERQATSRNRTDNVELSVANDNSVKKLDSANNSFKVFPNPTMGMVTVQLELDNVEDLTIEVLNQTGQVVKQIALGQQTRINQSIDLTDLPNGMYILKAYGTSTNLSQKVLVQH